MIVLALAGIAAGVLVARHHQLRTAREVEAATLALDDARALGARLAAGPPPDLALEAEHAVMSLDSTIARRGSSAVIDEATRLIRGEPVPPGSPVVRMDRASPSFSVAWSEGVVDERARARVLIGWRRGERVTLVLRTCERPV
jgi:hypothetical protein